MRRTPLKAKAETTRAFLDRGRVSSAESLSRSRRSQPPRRRTQGISPASPAQRRRVREIGFCVGCGASHDPEAGVWLTFAHFVARGQGGCDHELCGAPLCVRYGRAGCHDLFDDGKLDLLEVVVRNWELCRPMVQHALEHALPVPLLQRLANARVRWDR